jgi:hypothetical protein
MSKDIAYKVTRARVLIFFVATLLGPRILGNDSGMTLDGGSRRVCAFSLRVWRVFRC